MESPLFSLAWSPVSLVANCQGCVITYGSCFAALYLPNVVVQVKLIRQKILAAMGEETAKMVDVNSIDGFQVQGSHLGGSQLLQQAGNLRKPCLSSITQTLEAECINAMFCWLVALMREWVATSSRMQRRKPLR